MFQVEVTHVKAVSVFSLTLVKVPFCQNTKSYLDHNLYMTRRLLFKLFSGAVATYPTEDALLHKKYIIVLIRGVNLFRMVTPVLLPE
jgi:hypothetical protein